MYQYLYTYLFLFDYYHYYRRIVPSESRSYSNMKYYLYSELTIIYMHVINMSLFTI